MIDRFFSYVIDRTQQFIDRLQVDTSRANLGVWIAVINVAIVLLLVGGISISAIGLLQDLADQQGKARVQLARGSFLRMACSISGPSSGCSRIDAPPPSVPTCGAPVIQKPSLREPCSKAAC